jgi:hypothetical protein
MEIDMEIKLYDPVRWQSCNGTREGVVFNIYNALDAFGDTINFYHIKYSDGFGGYSMAMIAETELHQIEFELIK